jgi:hypothetical protein
MKRCTLNGNKRLIGGGGKPWIAFEAPEMGLGYDCSNPVSQHIGLRTSRIDHEYRYLLILLGSNAGKSLLEPPAGVMSHHEHHDGRGHDLLVVADKGIVCLGEGHGGGFLNSHDGWRGYRSHGSISATPDYDPPMSSDPFDDLSQASKDVAHIAVGVAVLGFQKFQVQRRSLERVFRESPSDPQDRVRQWIRSATDRC